LKKPLLKRKQTQESVGTNKSVMSYQSKQLIHLIQSLQAEDDVDSDLSFHAQAKNTI